jgi:CheY-like chemotaxis protein
VGDGVRTVLAVEDEETDRYILRWAFKKADLPHQLVTLSHGGECLDYLSGAPPYENREVFPLPSLLILDLKMPHVDGFEVLAWLADRPELGHLPAVVLSSSSDDSDVRRARQLGARDYFVKPLMMDDLVKILRDLGEKWLA